MDGWEDDDDLEIESTDGWNHKDLEPSDDGAGAGEEWSFEDEDEILDDNEQASMAPLSDNTEIKNISGVRAVAETPAKETRAPLAPSTQDDVDRQQQETSGDWSFDDDEILEDEEEEDKPLEEPSVNKTDEKVKQKPPPAALFLDRLAMDENTRANEAEQQSSHAAVAAAPPATKPTATKALDPPPPPPPSKPSADEWSFDDDSFLDAAEDEIPPQPNAKEEAMFQSLARYIETLPALLPSLNSVLEAEYNTYHHAVELTDYYKSRPQLYEYTLDTELPRMDYQVVLPSQERLTDKYQVQQYLLSQQKANVLIRSANQSLLADLLAQLTGPDCFIQHQYLATALASSCQFVIHPSFVECHCILMLSLPSATGDRLDVARLQVSIDFGQPPSVNYQLHKVELLLQDFSILRETAAFLSSLEEDSFVEENVPTSDDVVRDAFLAKLSQTQQFVEDSHAGLSSAWKQIDSVANVSKKFGFLKKGLTKLPTSEELVMEHASNEAQVVESRQPPPPPPRQPAPPPDVPRHTGTTQTTAIPPPPPPPPSSGDLRPQDRPKPILGGLLRNGLRRLAQTVTLPDEVDAYPSETTPALPVPKLFQPENEGVQGVAKPDNRETPVAPALPPPIQQPIAPPMPPPMAPPDTGTETLELTDPPSPEPEEDVQDGWDDDDLDLDVDDEDGADVAEATMKQQAQPPPPPPPKPYQATTRAPPPPPQPKPVHELVMEPKSPPIVASPMDVSPSVSNYSPEDDIVPTRKRWVNPRPGNRQLRA